MVRTVNIVIAGDYAFKACTETPLPSRALAGEADTNIQGLIGSRTARILRRLDASLTGDTAVPRMLLLTSLTKQSLTRILQLLLRAQ